MLALTHTKMRLLVFSFSLFFSFFIPQAFSADTDSLKRRLENETPIPIGEVIAQLEQDLLSENLTAREKVKAAQLYALNMIKIQQSASDDMVRILESLTEDPSSGTIIRLGLARMKGMNAKYTESFELFDKILKTPNIAPRTEALALAYLMVTYREDQIYGPVAELIVAMTNLITQHSLNDLKPLQNHMAANYYLSIRQTDIAMDFFEKSLRGSQEANDWILVSDNLYMLGIVSRNNGKYEDAVKYFQQAIEIDKLIDINYAEFLATYGLATTYFRSGQYQKALALSDKVIVHPLSSTFYNSELYKLRANAFLTLERFDEAEQSINIARDIFDEREEEQTTWRAELEEVAAKIAAAKGDYKKAYERYRIYQQIYPVAERFEDKVVVESSKLAYEIELQREKELRLEKENEAFAKMVGAIEETQKTQQNYNFWLTVFIILTILTLLVIVYFLRRSWETNKVTLEAMEKAEQHSQLKSEFISKVSHEIRTPLNAIIGFSQILTENLEKIENKKLTKQIANSSDMLLQLINDLLDFSKIEAGKLELDSRPHNMKKSIRKLADIFHAQAKNKGLKLKIKLDPELPNSLLYDDLRFQQILANLVSNALKFSEEGAIEIGLRVVKLEGARCKIETWVTDTGIGISEDQLQFLFQPFTQAERSIARKYGGTGLGLSICNNLLELMGSNLEVESKLGEGSRFFFSLEFEISQEQPVEDQKEQTNISTFDKTRVLLVEDNEINIQVILQMLANTNLEITCALNGIEAVEKVENEEFDILLMDINMPEMDGYEATRIIREKLHKTMPIIAITANAMKQDKQACQDAGMNKHLSKPLDKSGLLDVLDNYLNTK